MTFTRLRRLLFIRKPHAYEFVGSRFVIAGRIPDSWLGTSHDRLSLDFIDLQGFVFMGSSVDVRPGSNWLDHLTGTRTFESITGFSQINLPFIAKSQGRITLRLSGRDAARQSVFIPIIVKEFEPAVGVSKQVSKQHNNVPKRIGWLMSQQVNYHAELEELYNKRHRTYNSARVHANTEPSVVMDEGLLDGIFFSIEGTPDVERAALDDKYRELLEWSGPLLHGRAGRWNGFDFRVYSDDHGQHFHVIHKGRGIDARFSFPQIELLNYKNTQNTMRSKEVAAVREYFSNHENFKKLENEFVRRQ